MCGIIGYLGKKTALPVLLDGLHRMEYRGYDSAGIAVLHDGEVFLEKRGGKITNLEHELQGKEIPGTIGIGHIRWATHGAPTDANAHPHTDCKKDFFVVHNGILENAYSLRQALAEKGHAFFSQTDTEVLAHLIESYSAEVALEDAVQRALQDVVGTYGIVVLSKKEPRKLVAVRLGSPLVLGILGEGEYIVASDVTAIIPYTRQVVYCEDHEIVVLSNGTYTLHSSDRCIINRPVQQIEWDGVSAQRNGHAHFMEKEIFEQPQTLRTTLGGRIIEEEGIAKLGGIEAVRERLRSVDRIVIVACGTARFAALVGEYFFEEYAHIPTEVEYASEFRYRNPLLNERTAVIAVSQSGETADTLAALREAKRKGALTLGIVNVVGSSIAREVDAGVYIHAGPEIAVASTKGFTSQLAVLALMAIMVGRDRTLSLAEGKELLTELKKIPDHIATILKSAENIKRLAEKYAQYENSAFIGRKYNAPIAQEGALKLKEISYVHAEGFVAGEMKHGAIALIDEKFPTIAIVPSDSVYEKNVSNIEEIKARKGLVLAIATEGDGEVKKIVDDVVYIPKTAEPLTPLLTVVPLQLFAYYVACIRGRDVDQPRNLAKSVTVE